MAVRDVFAGLLGLALLGIAPGSAAAEEAAAQSTDPRRPAAITTEGVPPVPAELVDRLRQYQNMRSARFSSWAPDGRGILIGTRFANAAQVHRVYEPGGRREQWTFFEEPAQGLLLPGALDEAVLLMMGRGGDENWQLYLLDRKTGRETLLTDGKSRNEIAEVASGRSLVLFRSNERNTRDMDLYTMDPRQPGSRKLVLQVSNEQWFVSDLAADGSRALMNRFVSVNETYPAVLDLATGALEPIPAPAEGKVAFGDMAFAPDGRSVYLTTDARGEFAELARYDLQAKTYEWLTEDIRWDVEDVEVDPRSGRVVFTVNDNGASKLYLLEQGRRSELPLPISLLFGLEFSPDGTQLGFTLSRFEMPPDAYSLRIADKTLTRWTYSEVGGLNPQSFVQPTQIEVASFDGRRVPAYYIRPPAATKEKPAPVLISIHGGPEDQQRPEFWGAGQFYAAELGIAILAPNVRGSLGYGKTFAMLDNGEKREDSVKDIGALLDWIAAQPELDKSRVVVIGGSYGGYMVLASLIHFGDRIRAGIDEVGVSNFISFLEKTSAYRQDLRRVEYGDERDPKMREFLRKISPVNNADKIRSALLLVHGANDPRVPLGEAQQIAEKVRANGRQVWTVYASNEGHGFAKKDNRDYLGAVIVQFLQEHVLK